MNKYQLALNKIKALKIKPNDDPYMVCQLVEFIDSMQELVDMVTPIADMNLNTKMAVLTDGGNPNIYELVEKNKYKAPVQVTHVYGTIIECPVCHQPITNLGKYCCECGQRIKPYEND